MDKCDEIYEITFLCFYNSVDAQELVKYFELVWLVLCRKNENDPTVVAPQTKKNGTISATYRKLARSLPSSASAHDFRLFDMCSSSRGIITDYDEGLNCESESTKTNSKRVLSSAPRSSGWQRFFKLCKKSSIKRLPSFPPILMPKISRRKSRSARERVEIDNCLMSCTWKTFTLDDLQMATNNFSKDGQLVAVKRLNKGIAEEHVLNFLCEIGIIAHVNHPNTAKMIGYGVEGGTYLILQLSSLGSLGSLLHGSKEKLDWSKRYKIILGTAEGLLYLHENCQRRIIHRDIKADNILLSEDFEPQTKSGHRSLNWYKKLNNYLTITKRESTKLNEYMKIVFRDGLWNHGL
ncbi:Non-specific serine/threonine protein kinase [Handroanthus impetiginosus]|uniref:Non-specific serine/threonine protein kinase n=1 Tax=Handroanthus impetiginosus TaxID=429701 RepID=A0A2G9I7C9_9LAMI|nr:Non-specific serine/threonine protein kinase [Handroanthus impetiginosus]